MQTGSVSLSLGSVTQERDLCRIKSGSLLQACRVELGRHEAQVSGSLPGKKRNFIRNV
ncbi:hypothetical protein [Flexithrix dorotheae]|uniref:hypothetical protein n=1 Tax=Flexithrix dorotheae TaxID=70993 RepID=UPI0012F72E04|nr:hypothetical protein [Flexithrix dorotheae]